MRYSHVFIDTIGYELAPNVVTSADLEDKLYTLYQKLGLIPGQIQALTGIKERRFWDPGTPLWQGAAKAGEKALDAAGVSAGDIGMLIYGGVCRDNWEPATACAVADALDVRGRAEVLDLSNACLGVVNGIIHAANAIELGQIKAALVVSNESARDIVDTTIDKMLDNGDMETFKASVATMTGGSAAVAVVLTHASLSDKGHRLIGGAARSAAEHHKLCRWGPDPRNRLAGPLVMETDAAAVLENGVALGVRTWQDFLGEVNWTPDDVEKVICHQVGTGHRLAVMKAIGLPVERDFPTFEYLGNIGTVSLPITAAIADEQGFIKPGNKVGFLGIGSGLNSIMLALEW